MGSSERTGLRTTPSGGASGVADVRDEGAWTTVVWLCHEEDPISAIQGLREARQGSTVISSSADTKAITCVIHY